jgi:hypothetical protein
MLVPSIVYRILNRCASYFCSISKHRRLVFSTQETMGAFLLRKNRAFRGSAIAPFFALTRKERFAPLQSLARPRGGQRICERKFPISFCPETLLAYKHAFACVCRGMQIFTIYNYSLVITDVSPLGAVAGGIKTGVCAGAQTCRRQFTQFALGQIRRRCVRA